MQQSQQQDQQFLDLDQYKPEEKDQIERVDMGNRVKFSKLLSVQWNKIEKKNFSQFELRVLDTLQKLGSQQAEKVLKQVKEAETTLVVEKDKDEDKKKKKQGQPQKVQQKETVQNEQNVSKFLEICVGQELYVQVIRQRLSEIKLVSKLEEVEKDAEDDEASKGNQKGKKGLKPGAGGSKKKGTAGAPKKEDLMRLQLSRDKVNDATLKMLQMMGQASQEMKLYEEEFLRVEQAAKRIKSLKWLELKFAALILYANQLIGCHLESTLREEYAFELIYFLKNLYLKYRDYEGSSYLDNTKTEIVSPQAVKDLRKKLGDLHKNFHFSNRVLFNRYPRLVIDTDFNQAFSQTDVKPYKAQEELMESLASAKKPLLVFLNTMVGTGKTVMSVGITQYLQSIRDYDILKKANINDNNNDTNNNIILDSDLQKMQILYCCPLDNVRSQVGSSAYQKKLSFAIAQMWCDPQKQKSDQGDSKELGYQECARIVNSWSNINQEFPTLIISDFTTTLELLKEQAHLREDDKTVIRWQRQKKNVAHNPSKNGSQYILFIDEPTVDADFPNADTTKMLVQIMRYAPPITILSSATLPDSDRLPNFIKLFSKRYGGDKNIEIKTIKSQQFQIGCQVFSHDGHKFLPHYNIATKSQLKTVLGRLQDNPFMQRCYNANAYCELYDRSKRYGLNNLEDFEQFDLITQEIVQKKSIDLLTRLLDEDEALLQKICQEQDSQEFDSDESDKEEDQQTMQIDLMQEEEKQKPQKLNEVTEEDKIRFAAPYKQLRVKDLAGKMAHKFEGGCLIAVKDPLKLIRERFNWLLRDTKQAADYIKQYEKQLELLEKLKEKKEKEIDNEDERSKQVQAIEETMKLSIEFPDKLKINTLEHYKRFVAGSQVHLINRYRARKAFSLEGINLSLGVPDDVLLYLFAGIAVYTEKQIYRNELASDYFEEIQHLASNGQLAFIVADDSMCYGVNYPLNHVIVFDEMASERSMGALFQLIGRAGRVGVSWVANAYLEQNTFRRLIDYLEGKAVNDETKDEAFNIEMQSKKLIDELARAARERRSQQQQQQQQQEQQEQDA